MSNKTPASGYPTAFAQIESLRDDLRQHAATDERELATIRDDVKNLLTATGKQDSVLREQNVVLDQIKAGLAHRAKTEDETVAYERKKRLALWGMLLSLVSIVAGALLHHFLP